MKPKATRTTRTRFAVKPLRLTTGVIDDRFNWFLIQVEADSIPDQDRVVEFDWAVQIFSHVGPILVEWTYDRRDNGSQRLVVNDVKGQIALRAKPPSGDASPGVALLPRPTQLNPALIDIVIVLHRTLTLESGEIIDETGESLSVRNVLHVSIDDL